MQSSSPLRAGRRQPGDADGEEFPLDDGVGGTTRGLAMYVHEGELIMGAWNRADDDGGVSSTWMSTDEEAGSDLNSLFVRRPVTSETTYHAAMVMAGHASGFTGTFTGYFSNPLAFPATSTKSAKSTSMTSPC